MKLHCKKDWVMFFVYSYTGVRGKQVLYCSQPGAYEGGGHCSRAPPPLRVSSLGGTHRRVIYEMILYDVGEKMKDKML